MDKECICLGGKGPKDGKAVSHVGGMSLAPSLFLQKERDVARLQLTELLSDAFSGQQAVPPCHKVSEKAWKIARGRQPP